MCSRLALNVPIRNPGTLSFFQACHGGFLVLDLPLIPFFLGPCQIVGHVLDRFAINLIQMRIRLFVPECGTVIHLTLTDRLLVARVLRWHWLRKHEVWEEW